jgi:hypothetical protein
MIIAAHQATLNFVGHSLRRASDLIPQVTRTVTELSPHLPASFWSDEQGDSRSHR